MSKVFSAKLRVLEFYYEFLDGKTAKLTYRSPTTNEIDEAIARGDNKTPDDLQKNFAKRLSGDQQAIDALLMEQRESGNLYELIGELEKELADEKNAKRRT